MSFPQQPFLFLRHGETTANARDVISGASDDPLSPQGEAQARAAARLIADHAATLPLAAIWHSPLSRAARTAQAVAEATDAPLIAHPGLSERNWGIWEGQPRSLLVRSETPEGGESATGFTARIRSALAAITGSGLILIVAHSGTGREIHTLLTGEEAPRPANAEPILWTPAADGHWIATKLSPAC